MTDPATSPATGQTSAIADARQNVLTAIESIDLRLYHAATTHLHRAAHNLSYAAKVTAATGESYDPSPYCALSVCKHEGCTMSEGRCLSKHPVQAPEVKADPLREAVIVACDLLAERKYGNPARSPGHNARLALEAALVAPQPPASITTEQLDRETIARIIDPGALDENGGWLSMTRRWEALEKADAILAMRPASNCGYPSKEAMMAAVELEIQAALGRVQTVAIGRMIQKAADAMLALSPSVTTDRAAVTLAGQIAAVYGQLDAKIFDMSCDFQFDLARRLAANVGYVLVGEPQIEK